MSDKGTGTLQTRNPGHATPEVVVENSLALASTRGPSGRDDLSKSRRDLLAASQSTRLRAGQASHQRAMKRYEQPIMMAPRDNAGLIGKARPRTSSVADTHDLFGVTELLGARPSSQ